MEPDTASHERKQARDAPSRTRRAMLGAAAATVPVLAGASAARAADPDSVTLLPADSARNVVQPTADAVPLTLRAHPGQSAALLRVQDDEARDLIAVHRGGQGRGQIRFPKTDGSHGPFVIEHAGSTFNGVFDPTLYIGYNVKHGGQRIVDSEPFVSFTIEADYDDGAKRTVEQYTEIRSADGTLNVRPFFVQARRDATTLESFVTQARITGAPFGVYALTNGDPAGPGENPGRLVAQFDRNHLWLPAVDKVDNVIRVDALAGYAAALSLGANNVPNAATLRSESLNSFNFILGSQGRDVLRGYANPSGAPGAAIAVGANDNSGVGVFAVGSSLPDRRGLIARGREGQTGNLIEAQDSTRRTLGGFDRSGYFFTSRTSPPADSQVPANSLFLWFDSTSRRSRLMIKGRDAAGTIVTGSLDLR